MRKLEIDVNDLIMSKSGDYENIVRGTDNYLVLFFNFDRTWTKRKKVVHIADVEGNEYNSVITKNSVSIPKSVTETSRIYVQLYGREGRTTVKTNIVTIEQL